MKVSTTVDTGEPLSEREEVLLDIIGELVVRNNFRAAAGKAAEFTACSVLGQFSKVPDLPEGERKRRAL